jgi:dUTPase
MIKFFIEPGYDVKKPEREYGNAGIDFFIPNKTEAFVTAFNARNAEQSSYFEFSDEGDFIVIPSLGRVNIPSGIRSNFPANIALEAQNKSGIATKLGLVFGAGLVDSSYKGIIHISLINTSDKEVKLPLGMKATQFVPRFVDTSEFDVYEGITIDEFYKDFEFTNRGEGAFGSTGV